MEWARSYIQIDVCVFVYANEERARAHAPPKVMKMYKPYLCAVVEQSFARQNAIIIYVIYKMVYLSNLSTTDRI